MKQQSIGKERKACQKSSQKTKKTKLKINTEKMVDMEERKKTI